jgi:hypothetical protein
MPLDALRSTVPAGAYFVSASAPGHERNFYPGCQIFLPVGPGQDVAVIEGQDSPDINFKLGPGGSISGTVTDRSTANTLPGKCGGY